jgi:hypothetical protein
MLSTPKDEHIEPEQGVRRTRSPDASPAYESGTEAAAVLLRILQTSCATHGALHQALHEVMLRGQPEMLRGFTDALQERLKGPDDGQD